MNKQPKRLIRAGRRGKVIRINRGVDPLKSTVVTRHLTEKKVVRIFAEATARQSFSNGPFKISKVKVVRQHEGQPYEEMKRCIVDCRGMPVDFGSRKKLDRKLEQMNLGYAKFLMTQGTKAEGI